MSNEQTLKQTIIKTCSCGEEYTLETFRTCPPASGGLYLDMDDGDEPSRYEYRNCECGSTMAIGLNRNGGFYND